MKFTQYIDRKIAPVTLSALLKAFFSTFALCNIGSFSSSGILSMAVFGLLLLFFLRADEGKADDVNADGWPRFFAPACAVLALLFTFFYVAAEHQNLTGSFDSGLFRAIYLLFTALGLYALFCSGIRLLMIIFAKTPVQTQARPLSRRWKLLIFAGLLLCWLPWFLYDFPGVMSPDSISQFSQATGLKGYSDHHPVMHTLLISLCYKVGFGLTGSTNAGIACYTIVQMLLLSLIETGCLSLLAQKGVSRRLLVLWFLFWGLVPYNGIFAVTMWKDVLFSAFMLLYVMELFVLLSAKQLSWKKHWKLLAGLALSGWLVCMFRSNGLYVFLFMLPFTLIAFRKNLKLMGGLQILVLALALLVKGPVYDAWDVEKPHFTESLSIPLQQVACVVSNGRELTEDQKESINQIVDISLIPDYYNPVISDPIKALVLYNNADYLEEHKGEYFRLWLQIGLQHPGDYVQAFIDQTKGYWFPAPATLRTNEGISPNEIGLSWPKILRGMVPVKISEILLKLPDILPVYGILWSIGAFTWLLLFLTVFQFLYGKKEYLLLYLPFIGVILTLLIATPVASDIRYAYSVLLGMPFLISAALLTRRAEALPPEG